MPFTPRTIPSHIPRVEHALPGHPGTIVCVYGQKIARDAQEAREQGYFVAQNGMALARAELLDAEKAAVHEFLKLNYPQHSRI